MQNINFYQPALRKQAAKFSARAMVQAGAVLTVAVVAIYVFSLSQISALRVKAESAEQQRAVAAQQLVKGTQGLTAGNTSGSDEVQIETLQKQVLAYERLQRMIDAEGLGNTAGHSGILVALARRNVPGMWLTHFEISGRGETLLLEGRSSVAQLVPQYLQSLAQEPHFTGTEFRLFQILRPEVTARPGDDAYVNFRVGTTQSDDSSRMKGAGT